MATTESNRPETAPVPSWTDVIPDNLLQLAVVLTGIAIAVKVLNPFGAVLAKYQAAQGASTFSGWLHDWVELLLIVSATVAGAVLFTGIAMVQVWRPFLSATRRFHPRLRVLAALVVCSGAVAIATGVFFLLPLPPS